MQNCHQGPAGELQDKLSQEKRAQCSEETTTLPTHRLQIPAVMTSNTLNFCLKKPKIPSPALPKVLIRVETEALPRKGHFKF